MTATTLKLAQLRFGHDPLAGPEINARCTGRLEGTEKMAAMLASQGQLERLMVVPNPTESKEGTGLYFVVNGNRRLAAMQKHWQPDADVMVEITKPEKLLEKSLATNTSLPMHPVDRYRAYAEVIKRDKIDAAQLARRFGVSAKEMQKSLALGALCDDVLDAWLADIVTQESAAAFTLQPDKNEQAKLLAASIKSNAVDPRSIRAKIVGKRKDVGNLIAFVGIDAYRKAGGKLDEDLFGIKHIAHNPETAVKLANAALDKECRRLMTAGWTWASRADEMSNDWGIKHGSLARPKMPKLTDDETKARGALVDGDPAELAAFDSVIMARGFKPDQMATAGCVVTVTAGGNLEIISGVITQLAKKKKTAKADKAKPSAPKEPTNDRPPQISARLAADLTETRNRAVTALVATLPPKKLVAAIRKEFDADDYFDRLPAAMVAPAVAEMGIAMSPNVKPKVLLASAKSGAKKTGWLPPELRTAGYENPKKPKGD